MFNIDSCPLTADQLQEVTAWRHHLHRHPEIAFEEVQTASFIAARLAEFGLTVSTGLAGTGVVGTLARGHAAKAIALRADIDALPIAESTGLPYASVNSGRMHACGHDGHTAILLGAARALAADPTFDGTVHFVFQPAEEVEGGGRVMVEQGLFDKHPCQNVFGLHSWPTLAFGATVVRDGAMMAAFETFTVKVRSAGGHAAMPEASADAIVAASQIVSALQTVVSRNVTPTSAAVLSITKINGGDTFNVLPSSVTFGGTVRWLDAAVGALVRERMGHLISSVAAAYGCSAEFEMVPRYPATVNAPREAGYVRATAEKIGLPILDHAPSMASEDFAYMLQARPGAYLWLGGQRDGENPGLHSERFDFHDGLLPMGIAMWTQLALGSPNWLS